MMPFRLNLSILNHYSIFLLTLILAIATLSASFNASSSPSASKIPTQASDICPIKVGESLPDITLKDINGQSFDLNKAIKQAPTLLIFYRGSWCPYCNVHLGELKTIEKELKSLGYQIIAISPDLPKNLKMSLDKSELTYTLLSDSTADAAKSLGLAFTVDDETFKMLIGYNIDIEKASGQTHRILPVPAALLLDQTGKVTFSFYSPDYKVRVDKRVLLAAAQSQTSK